MQKVVLALLAVVGVVMLGGPAGGQEPSPTTAPPATTATTAGATTATTAPADDGESSSLRGTLDYEGEGGEDVPVEGLEVTVRSADGSFEETTETDDEGFFEVVVPGPGQYSTTIDAESLPEGVELREGSNATLGVTLATGQSRAVLFRLDAGFGDEGGGRSDIDRFMSLFVEGIRYGLTIAICAIGLSLIFGTTGLVNFAHGEMVTFGAMVAYIFNVTIGWHLLIAAPLAIAISVVAGFVIDRIFWRPLSRRGTGLIAMLVTTIGLGLLIRYIYNFQFGGRRRPFGDYALQFNRYDWGPISIVPRDVATIIIATIVLIAVALFLQKTRLGKAMRAVADDPELAESSGVDVERIVGVVWAVGFGLAALGGVLLGLAEQISWDMGFSLLLLMFAGTTLGGLGTAYGALLGSLIVGILVQVSTLWVPFELKNVGALLVLALILLVRPQGILGQAERVG